MDWTRVKWSEAAQVLDLAETPAETRLGDAAASPQAYFARLRGEGRGADAVDFLAQALPRLESVAWAARVVRDAPPADGLTRPRERALRAALLWVQDPSEQRRRAAYEAARSHGAQGAEQLAAMAVFFSGGSVAAPQGPALNAPRAVSGRFVAGAIKAATARQGRSAQAALDRALDLGAALAAQGVAAGA